MCKVSAKASSSSPRQFPKESEIQTDLSSSTSSSYDDINVHPEVVETTLETFLEAGKTANEATTVNLHVLKDIELLPSDIAPVVEVQVEKVKDGSDEKKNKQQKPSAASLVKDNLTETLSSKYTGKVDQAEFVLLARVYVASKGNAVGRQIGYFLGCGLAKVTVSYCLYSRRTQKVVMAKQLSYGSSLLNSGENLVQDLASKVGEKICREVNFVVFCGKDVPVTPTSRLTL